MPEHSAIEHYRHRYVLVRRGGVNCETGKPATRMAYVDRLSRDHTKLRGKMLKLGGRSHGTYATKNVTIEVETIEADWPDMPTQAEIKRAKAAVPSMTIKDEWGRYVA